jgi:hypothetical protein
MFVNFALGSTFIGVFSVFFVGNRKTEEQENPDRRHAPIRGLGILLHV